MLTGTWLSAQFTTAVLDGVIGPGEYGTHVDGANQQLEGSTTYYMSWDNTNLYLAFSGSNATEGAVIYLDVNPTFPVNGGTDADGSLTGFWNYDANQAQQPFRADFVLYYKDSYHEYRYADGAGYWGTQTANTLANGSNLGSNTMEIAVPWNVLTQGGGRPRRFNWHTFKVYYANASNNGVYHAVPPGNPTCACNTEPNNTFVTHYYNVFRTGNFISTLPFSTQSFTYHEDNSAPGSGGYILNGGSFFDVTVNDNSLDNLDNDPGNHVYDNNGIANRLLVEGNLNIANDLYIGPGSALLPADNGSGAVVATLTMTGDTGAVYNFGRIDANPEASTFNDWNNRRMDLVIDGNITLEASPLFKERYRLANITVNSGDSLLGPDTDSTNLELQWGLLNNNGVVDFGDGSAGVVDLGTRGDWSQQNDYFFNSSLGTGQWFLHDVLIGRNSSALRPVNGGNAVLLQIQGDFENYDEFVAKDGSGELDVVMAGRFAQYIRGNVTETTAGRTTFHNLEIANSTGLGDYNNSGDVFFVSFGGGNIEYVLTGQLTLTSGDLVTRDRTNPATVHNLTLTDTATVNFSGASSNLTTAGSCFIDGPVRYEVANALPVVREFPVGKSLLLSGYLLGDYRHLTLDLDHDAATPTVYTVEMFLDDRSNFYTFPPPTPELITWISRQRYWNVTKSAGANVQNALITLDYDVDERNDGVTNPGGLRIVKDDGVGNWVNIAVGGGGTGTGTGRITSNSFTDFSDFTLASIDGGMPLPVEMLSFAAVRVDDAVRLDWSTANEINSDYFVVERSRDRLVFRPIGEVPAAGNSAGLRAYRHWDRDLEPGVEQYHYRLRAVDQDGSTQFSEIRAVNLTPGASIAVFPNPAASSLTVRSEGPMIQQLRLYNGLGQVVADRPVAATQVILAVETLAAGMYYLEIRTATGVVAQSIQVRY